MEDDIDINFERGRSSSDSVSSELSEDELSRFFDFPFPIFFLRLSFPDSSESTFESESSSLFVLCLRFFFSFGLSASSSLSSSFRERFFFLLFERSSSEPLSSGSSARRRFRLLDSLFLCFEELCLRFLELKRSSSLSPEPELWSASESTLESHAEAENAGIYTIMSNSVECNDTN